MQATDRAVLVSLIRVDDALNLMRRAAGQAGIDPALADALRGVAAQIETELIVDQGPDAR